jgi:hypothetical protein
MIPIEPDIFKLLGISTSVVAQGSYGLLFYLSAKGSRAQNKSLVLRWPEVTSVFILGLTTIYLYPLLGDFTTPSLIYIVVTTITIVLALNRRFNVSSKSFGLVIGGVACFYVADVLTGMDLLTINPQLRAISLTFFALSHWLIFQGMCIQFDEEIKNQAE